MSEEDEDLEQYSEKLRSRESRDLSSELSRFYHRLRTLEGEGKMEELYFIRRKIGALEEEIGRRKKNDAWPW